MYHPWRHLRTLPAWTLVWSTLPATVLGFTDFRRRRIVLEPRQLQAERRSTITHELVHVERGPAPRGCWWEAREERAVDQLAARRLITLDALAEALAWSSDPYEVADELWVDVPTLQARLDHLHPSERHQLRRRLAHLLEGESSSC